MPNENEAPNEKTAQEPTQAQAPSTKEQILALEAEIKESQTALDNAYAEYYVKNHFDEEQMQLAMTDAVEMFKNFEKAKMPYLQQELASKLQKHKGLLDQLGIEAIEDNMKAAEEKLLAKYPKANAKVVMEFMEHDLTKRQQAELMQLDPTDRLLAAYELMPQSKGKELPQELNDLNDDGSLDNSENEFMNRR